MRAVIPPFPMLKLMFTAWPPNTIAVSQTTCDRSFPFLRLVPSPPTPCMQDDEVEGGGVSAAYDINKAVIEQQLQTRIYDMSREEAKE